MSADTFLQICIPSEPGATTGAGLAHLLRTLLTEFPSEWVALKASDLSGASRMPLLVGPFNVLRFPIKAFFELLEGAEQIDWASVYLCKTQEAAETIGERERSESALKKAEVLVRVVDQTYYYVYAPVARLSKLRDRLVGEEKLGRPEELDYPF